MNRMGNRTLWNGLAALVLGIVSLGPVLAAQDNGQGQPARAVRLSYVDGQVTLAQNGQALTDQALVNTPLFEGMQLTTADNGKAEIQFEDGSVARLSPDSSLTIAALRGAGESASSVLVLNNGLAYFEFQGGGLAGAMSVQFGGASVATSGFTVLRITLDNPPGQLAVFSGNARLDAGGGAISADLHGGESIALDSDSPAVVESIESDSWDAWNSDRDQALLAEANSQTGASSDLGANDSPEWSDLDANGNWYNVPGQGYVWSPYSAASAGWDPYGYGNWMWTPGYGYLWVSGYPWGYLPYQCGAWNFYDGFGWGWAPGFGGCNPWWGMGYYGGPNIGRAPNGYQIVPRPLLPRHPMNPRPVATIAVNRSGPNVHFVPPLRDRNAPVTIAGSSVVALRPMPSRQGNNRTIYWANQNRPQSGGQRAPGGGQITVTRPGYATGHPAGPAPAAGPGWQSPSATNPNSSGRGAWNNGAGNQRTSGGAPGGNPPSGNSPGNETRPGGWIHGGGSSGRTGSGGSSSPSGGVQNGGQSGGTPPSNESRPNGRTPGWNPPGGSNSGTGSHPSGGLSGGNPSGGNSGGGSRPSGGSGAGGGGNSGGGGGFRGGGGGGNSGSGGGGNSGGGFHGGGGGGNSGGGGGGGSHSGGGGGGNSGGGGGSHSGGDGGHH